MILGRDIHPASACFDEIDAVLEALAPGRYALNAHVFPNEIPPGMIVFQTENVGTQVTTDMFEGYEIHDMFASNVEKWKAAGRKATHVPIGWHASMKRFEMKPWAERTIDVVFCGVVNDRRAKVLNELRAKGLEVVVVGPGQAYGAERDVILARSKLGINILHEEGNLFPVLRAAHAAANGLPMVHEQAPEIPAWAAHRAPYEMLVDVVGAMLQGVMPADHFEPHTMTLPDPWKILRSFEEGGHGRRHHDLEAMYEADRGGPVSVSPLVCIVAPTYRESERVARASRDSRNKVRTHMAEAGINSFVLHLADDSLVCRMRQIACHQFLISAATHMLFWDADITARDVDCATKMVLADLPIVAGAAPFKDMTGRTVHNLFPEMERRIHAKEPLDLPNGCIEVRDAGSGFMLVQRRVLIELQQAHPEMLHWSRSRGLVGAPLWALFDTGVIDGEYLSEDYRFCRLWQQHGGKVHVYVPARFTHHGEYGYEASFMEQYGLAPRT